MISHIAILLISLFLLAKGSDYFIEYIARISKRFGVSDFIIGLTVTSIGTSIPELASSISATIEGHPGIIIGNVVGSNIANIGLVMGVSAMIRPFTTEKKMHDRDGFLMLVSVLLFFGFALDNRISFLESIIFLVFYVFYLFFVIKSDREKKKVHFRDFMRFVFDFEYVEPIKKSLSSMARLRKAAIKPKLTEVESTPKNKTLELFTDLLITFLSGIAIIFGAKYLVQEAVWLAQVIGVPDSVIGLSMIALGTSLPELLVSISAVKKNKGGIVIGNIIGSSIANILLIIGVCGVLSPLEIAELSVTYTIPIMLFFSLTLMYFVKSDWQIKRSQGALAVSFYFIFIVLAFLQGWS